MRFIRPLLVLAFLVCAGCSDANGGVQGGGGGDYSYGRVKIGVPF